MKGQVPADEAVGEAFARQIRLASQQLATAGRGSAGSRGEGRPPILRARLP